MRFFAIQPDVMATLNGITDAQASTLAGKEALVDDATWQNAGTVSNYGFDLHGNELNSGFDGAKHPVFMAVYLQDKIEYNDLIINAGLRYDYFNTDDRTLIDPANPGLDPQTGLIIPSAWRKVDAFQQVSPRLGFSFPVSERTVFYMQYGKFIQMSELNNIYFGQAQYTRQLNPKFFYINPVGFGLEPVRTTSYEIGFRQQLSSYAAFDITGFYKNIKGQIQTGRQRAAANALISTYERFQNGDFATTKGLEFRFTLRRVNRLQAQINYTLTNAEGTASTETSFHGAVYNNTEKPTVISPLDYAPTHTGSIIADYRFAKNDGGRILERLGLNAIFTFSSGHPYTYVYAPPGGQVDGYNVGVDYMLDTRSRQALEPLGSSTTPWNFNVDLRLDKTFSLLQSLNATVYMRVTNLFNTKNVLNVYQRTGNATDDGVLADPAYSGQFIDKYGAGYAPMYKAINLTNGQAYWDEVGNQLYAHPRQLIFGLQLVY